MCLQPGKPFSVVDVRCRSAKKTPTSEEQQCMEDATVIKNLMSDLRWHSFVRGSKWSCSGATSHVCHYEIRHIKPAVGRLSSVHLSTGLLALGLQGTSSGDSRRYARDIDSIDTLEMGITKPTQGIVVIFRVVRPQSGGSVLSLSTNAQDRPAAVVVSFTKPQLPPSSQHWL